MPKRFFLCLGVPGSERPLGVDKPEREPAPGVAPPGVVAGVARRPDARAGRGDAVPGGGGAAG